METLMFPLKFDLLFPSLSAAKETAKKLNFSIRRPARPADPREFKRMQDELRLAQDKVRMQVIARNLFL